MINIESIQIVKIQMQHHLICLTLSHLHSARLTPASQIITFVSNVIFHFKDSYSYAFNNLLS